MSRVTLSLSGTEVLCREEHPSLLIALEAHQVEVEYQCRSGYCGSCRCRLVAGQVDWLTEPLAFINEGEILPCCCRAKGDIEIEMYTAPPGDIKKGLTALFLLLQKLHGFIGEIGEQPVHPGLVIQHVVQLVDVRRISR